MSTRSSLAYRIYSEGIVHIYLEQNEQKYYITDDRHSIIELPEKLAKIFAMVIDAKKAEKWQNYKVDK